MARGPRSGREILLELLASEGIRYIFGNPGTTELPLIDELSRHGELQYVLALQEATAAGIADGYSLASGRTSFVNLHSVSGLTNGLSNLANAAANGSPVVFTAGQQHTRHLIAEPLLGGDTARLARSLCKWSHEVRHTGELGIAMRRAFRLATAPPSGPVFVSLPMDVLDGVADTIVPPPSRVEAAASDGGALDGLAELLATADSPTIVVGDEVARSGGMEAAVRLAEALGAPVLGAPLCTHLNFPSTHPLWRGPLGFDPGEIGASLQEFDRVLALGAPVFLTFLYSPEPAVPDSVELLQVHPDPGELGRTYAVTLGVAGSPASAAAALASRLCDRVPEAARRQRFEEARARHERERRELEDAARSRYGRRPLAPIAAAHALMGSLPEGTIVVDEAVTVGGFVRAFLRAAEPRTYFFDRGGGLGWGMPAAIGAKLARPDRPVVCLVGDGSAMYSPQALWTAAHHEVPVVFVVLNNREYRILKYGLDRLKGGSEASPRYVGMDLTEPAIDFVALASSMGVEARRVESEDEVQETLAAALDRGRPLLLEVPIAGHGKTGTSR